MGLIAREGQTLKSLSSGAENVNAGIYLNRKLSQIEKAQMSANQIRRFSDGRIRYYTAETPASTKGMTRGASYVTEWNPQTTTVRGWYECYDQSGKVVRIHPKDFNGRTATISHYPPTGKELGK
jgi:hypothetical protein